MNSAARPSLFLRIALLVLIRSFMSQAELPVEIRSAQTIGDSAETGASSLLPGLSPTAKYVFPDFAQPGEHNEDIKVPEPLTDEEKMVLRSTEEMSTDELTDLLQVYERMGNAAMLQSLSKTLLKRVPDHPLASQLRNGADNPQEVRKVGYLEQKADEVMAGKKSSDPDAVAAQARALLGAKQSDQAIELLESLRRTTFGDHTFPYVEDLGYAYLDRQRWNEAETAFMAVLGQRSLAGNTRQRIGKHLDLVRVEHRIANVRTRTYADPDAALTESDKILKDLPDHPSAIAFRVECLQYAGKTSEALAMLERLKTGAASAPAFAYQRLLGYSYQQLKNWDAAQGAFEEMRSNGTFSDEAHADAAKALVSTDISKLGEEALIAAGFGDLEKAEIMIADLEKKYPNNVEAFSYRCALLARTGKSTDALKLLDDKKRELAATGKPFPLQDTVGDVLVARKEFDNARTAYQEILDNPKYDWSMRRRAMDALPLVRRAELLEVGFLALRDRRLERAKTAARNMQDEFGPNTRELRLLLSEIHLSQNRPKVALAELEELRRTTPANQPFEGTSSVATALMRTGRVNEALDAFQDVLSHYRAYTPYEAMQARWEMRAAIPLAKPVLEANVAHRSEADGTVSRTEAAYSGPWWGSWRAQVVTHGDFINLKSNLTHFNKAASEERVEALVRLQHRLTDTLVAEGTLGGSQDDILYGARIGNFLTPGLNWSASFNGNGRSTDSIPLEALDARENRADLAFGGPLPGPWNFDLHASANWVRVGSTDVGHGVGGSAALEYVVQTETEKRGEFAVGYLGEYRQFTAADANSPFASLVDAKTNRHGVTAAYRRALDEKWRLTAQVGGFYAFDESAFQYMGSLGVQHYFSDDFMAYLDLRYDSNSKSAGNDTGAYEANLGLSKTF